MAFKVKTYGNGSLGDVTSVSTTINSYARVTAVTSNSVTIDTENKIEGEAKFVEGAVILLHVSSTTNSSYRTYLGKYLVANVTAVSGGVLTLDENPTTGLLPSANVGQYRIQAIAIAQYRNLTLSAGTTITPPVYSAASYHGGIVAIMCSGTLTFSGGHISLSDRGIPVGSTSLRPKLNQESSGQDDLSNYSAWENDCSRFFPLNCGDGAAFIIAKAMTFNSNSRIGNVSSYGVNYYRGSANSFTYNETAPSNVTNVGGSSILIAAESINNFQPRMISKYRSSTATAGVGLARCYIASETKLKNDEGLYAYDCISNKNRIRNHLNITSYGNGSFGDIVNNTNQLNNYATVTAISGNKVTYKSQTTNGLAQIAAGALVMIHFNTKSMSYYTNIGRFYIAKVVADNGSVLTLDTTPPFSASLSQYNAQVVSIPQANNFTLSTTNANTLKYTGTQGGIFAIAVKGNCNLSNGIINVMDKGGGVAYGRNGLSVIGNAQNSNKLPIGDGHGSIFILAQNITMNTNTRIGATYTGNAFGGNGDGTNKYTGGGYRGRGGTSNYGGAGWYSYGGTYNDTFSTAAVGASTTSNRNGVLGAQGAHVMIIASTITGFNQNAISTGGNGNQNSGHGGAGYGGGSYKSSSTHKGGGASGWAFVYCNTATSQNTSGTVYDG